MLYKAFHVNALADVTTLDDGLVSLVEAPVHVNAIIINTSATEGNVIECWIGNKMVVGIYDYCLDTQEEAVGFTGFSIVKIGRLPIDLDVPAGQTFKVGSNCGAVGHHLYGAYEYKEKT
ncbi:MAG: hypothetical protein GH151_10945 [Bacteroidetes bacterium]|nr:hypothetical protein [Bacteroidota bacterium]